MASWSFPRMVKWLILLIFANEVTTDSVCRFVICASEEDRIGNCRLFNASNHDLQDVCSSSEGKKVPLAVVFYAAVPFIVLSIVLIIALVYLIYKRRREQFEKKSEQPADNVNIEKRINSNTLDTIRTSKAVRYTKPPGTNNEKEEEKHEVSIVNIPDNYEVPDVPVLPEKTKKRRQEDTFGRATYYQKTDLHETRYANGIVALMNRPNPCTLAEAFQTTTQQSKIRDDLLSNYTRTHDASSFKSYKRQGIRYSSERIKSCAPLPPPKVRAAKPDYANLPIGV